MKRSPQTRRDFFKTATCITAAGMAAPYFFTAAQAEEAADEKLVVGAIGVGGQGTYIGKKAAPLCRIVACADVYLTHANKYAALFNGKCEVYQDYRRILDRKDIQAVLVATPDHWHTKIAIEALEAGKDVYCEKPLTLTMEESKLICETVKRTHRVFQVGTQQRSEYNLAFLEAIAIARSGRLGDKLKARASVGNAPTGGPFENSSPPEDLNWDFWLGQAPKVPYCKERCTYTFRWWFDYSGGQVTDWGVHHTDIALWALGGENTGVVEVEGKGEFPLGQELTRDYLLGKKSLADLPNSYNVAASFDCTLTLANGSVIQLTSGNNDVFIAGEKGHLAVNRGGIRGKFVEELKSNPADRDWLAAEVAKLYRGMPLGSHMANFFHCIKTRELPISDVFTHYHSMNACHMANIAMLLGRKLRWDNEKFEFVGDAEANLLLRRRQREPYTIKV